jgi:hypothetical protein
MARNVRHQQHRGDSGLTGAGLVMLVIVGLFAVFVWDRAKKRSSVARSQVSSKIAQDIKPAAKYRKSVSTKKPAGKLERQGVHEQMIALGELHKAAMKRQIIIPGVTSSQISVTTSNGRSCSLPAETSYFFHPTRKSHIILNQPCKDNAGQMHSVVQISEFDVNPEIKSFLEKRDVVAGASL